MKTEKEKKFSSKEDAKRTMKKIGVILSVVTFIKLAFWIVVDALAFKTLFDFIISDEVSCMFLAIMFAFCSSALIYMVYRVAMHYDVDPNSEDFGKIKALCWSFDIFGIGIGLMVVLGGVSQSPFAMLLAGALGLMPIFSHREAVKMAVERLMYERFAKYTIDNVPDK
ncbi:MAG: hypothetical protein IJG85_04305 [Eubacteriaceae bacterium]|nr:hypothetical protein [Eubacteriaceae bacterium]